MTPAPPPSSPRASPKPISLGATFCTLSLIAVGLLAFLVAWTSVFPVLTRVPATIDEKALASGLAPLDVVTLVFNHTTDHLYVQHNCVHISNSRHNFFIYTDDLSEPYCRLCTCIKFTPVNCTCPDPKQRGCSLCEKMLFLQTAITTYEQFVFIDSDLVIIHPHFLDRLQIRAHNFDFLAAPGFGKSCVRKYVSTFNSGLFFMRRLANVDYSQMYHTMMRLGQNNDQNVLSSFVHDNYQHWDILSLRWHCRFISATHINIPSRLCYTYHGRGSDLRRVLEAQNSTLLTIS